MQNPFLYPGNGQVLHEAVSAGSNIPLDPDQSVVSITAGGFTVPIAAGSGLELSFFLEFEDAATGDIKIYRKGSAGDDEFDTLSITAQHTAEWKAGEALTGDFYVEVDTDEDAIGVWGQIRLN